MAKSTQPIIIKRVKKAAHAHHGGAWKIAYADFVTAMMAFFLLMWLISMTTQEQKIGLAEYFAPAALSSSTSGAGGILNGTALDQSGAKSSAPRDAATATTGQDDGARRTTSGRASDREVSRPVVSAPANNSAIASLRQALRNMPEIAELSKNIVVDEAKDGLNVSIVDQDGRSMFAEGSITPLEPTRRALQNIAPVMRRMPNRIQITGYTSAVRPGSSSGWSGWELSSGRASAVREILSGAGIPDNRFFAVTGKSDTDPAFPDNPYLSANRRVTITLLNAEPPLPPNVVR
ncbi:flagellar motor protein MotB [Terrarubrum flagellatum]|uniref:flagellar motor protein MotB n=1 Tax=Terrirubrum flagellatum TaxID=2895980 RepID=UPI003144E525